MGNQLPSMISLSGVTMQHFGVSLIYLIYWLTTKFSFFARSSVLVICFDFQEKLISLMENKVSLLVYQSTRAGTDTVLKTLLKYVIYSILLC